MCGCAEVYVTGTWGDQRATSASFPRSPASVSETGLSTSLELTKEAELARQYRDHPVAMLSVPAPPAVAFYVGSGDSSLDPRANTASSLSTEPSPLTQMSAL